MIAEGPAKTAGIAVGEAAAAAMIAARANDGSAPPAFYQPPSSNPGEWQVTPGCSAAGGAFFHWGNVTPFAIRSASQFRLGPPPPLTSNRYARSYNEVKEVGWTNSTERPSDRADVARFYAAVSPVGVWNPVARLLSIVKQKSESQSARDFALLNMAMSDAAVATFDTKSFYNWRPETAIRNGGTESNQRTNPDPTFVPFIVTPCFPGYPSAHATLSSAAREVLEQNYGTGQNAITLSSAAVSGVSLTYITLEQITEDIDDARVYGIHFRFDQEGGAKLGLRIGRYVYDHNLQPARSSNSVVDSDR